MAESQRRSIFGNHDIRFFNLSDWTSAAYYKVLGDVTLDFPAEFAELKGGSNLFIWDSAITSFNPTVSIVAREMSSDIISTNLAATVTEYAADSAGDVIDEANVLNIAPLCSDVHRKPCEFKENPERATLSEALKRERATTIRKEYGQASGSAGHLVKGDDMVYSLQECRAA